MPRLRKVKPPAGGQRIGTKRSDMRFRSPDGSEWDSKFEWQVYDVIIRFAPKGTIRRTKQGGSDTLSYTVPVRDATCNSCGETKVSKHRTYTPDLFQNGADAGRQPGSYFIEIKGYLRAAQRSLLRAFCKARPDIDLRIIYQRDFPINKKLSVTQWTAKYLKIPYAVWKGNGDIAWQMPVKTSSSSTRRKSK